VIRQIVRKGRERRKVAATVPGVLSQVPEQLTVRSHDQADSKKGKREKRDGSHSSRGSAPDA